MKRTKIYSLFFISLIILSIAIYLFNRDYTGEKIGNENTVESIDSVSKEDTNINNTSKLSLYVFLLMNVSKEILDDIRVFEPWYPHAYSDYSARINGPINILLRKLSNETQTILLNLVDGCNNTLWSDYVLYMYRYRSGIGLYFNKAWDSLSRGNTYLAYHYYRIAKSRLKYLSLLSNSSLKHRFCSVSLDEIHEKLYSFYKYIREYIISYGRSVELDSSVDTSSRLGFLIDWVKMRLDPRVSSITNETMFNNTYFKKKTVFDAVEMLVVTYMVMVVSVEAIHNESIVDVSIDTFRNYEEFVKSWENIYNELLRLIHDIDTDDPLYMVIRYIVERYVVGSLRGLSFMLSDLGLNREVDDELLMYIRADSNLVYRICQYYLYPYVLSKFIDLVINYFKT